MGDINLAREGTSSRTRKRTRRAREGGATGGRHREALRAGGRTLHGWLRLFGFTFALSLSFAFPMPLYVFLLDLAVGWRTAVPPSP